MGGSTATITGTNTDPEFRKRRASFAARASHGTDSLIKRLVDRAPDLTPEQRDRLATILRPGDQKAGAE